MLVTAWKERQRWMVWRSPKSRSGRHMVTVSQSRTCPSLGQLTRSNMPLITIICTKVFLKESSQSNFETFLQQYSELCFSECSSEGIAWGCWQTSLFEFWLVCRWRSSRELRRDAGPPDSNSSSCKAFSLASLITWTFCKFIRWGFQLLHHKHPLYYISVHKYVCLYSMCVCMYVHMCVMFMLPSTV